ncbi:MAG: hypothetical protein KGS60_12610 [Verrucomicrobia bacterium]|nr:hypothetical protein [Verrucomicrobiota bacterium]
MIAWTGVRFFRDPLGNCDMGEAGTGIKQALDAFASEGRVVFGQLADQVFIPNHISILGRRERNEEKLRIPPVIFENRQIDRVWGIRKPGRAIGQCPGHFAKSEGGRKDQQVSVGIEARRDQRI